MKTFETSATVEDQGRVQVVGVPFAAGTQVQVIISPKRVSAEEFGASWRRVCDELRARPGLQSISDEEIGAEIERQRAGQ